MKVVVTLKTHPIFVFFYFVLKSLYGIPFFPICDPIGCRYPVGWLGTFMEKIRTRASSLLLKTVSPFQISLLVKCLPVWHFTDGERDHMNCKKRGSATSFEQHPWYLWDQEYEIHGSRGGREWIQCRVPRKITTRKSLDQLSIWVPVFCGRYLFTNCHFECKRKFFLLTI